MPRSWQAKTPTPTTVQEPTMDAPQSPRRRRKYPNKLKEATRRAKADAPRRKLLSPSDQPSTEHIKIGVHMPEKVEVTDDDAPMHKKRRKQGSAPSTPQVASWHWSNLDVYFDSCTTRHVQQLASVRKSLAQTVSTYRQSAHSLAADETTGVAIGRDSDLTCLEVYRSPRRGRNYRDVWAEYDYLIKEKREDGGDSVSLDQVVQTGSELVHGYDDDLFQSYIDRLEHQYQQTRTKGPEDKCGRKRKRPDVTSPLKQNNVAIQEQGLDKDVLPNIPSSCLHPASCGRWTAPVALDPCHVHPASFSRSKKARWQEEVVQSTDDNSTDPKSSKVDTTTSFADKPAIFGDAVEEDEISVALQHTISKLVPLSQVQWRRTQTLLERVQMSCQLQQIEREEKETARRLERMYMQLFPPTTPSDNNTSQAAYDLTAPRDAGRLSDPNVPRPLEIRTTPQDVIEYCGRLHCLHDCALRPAVEASIEYGMRLQVGEELDVLDQNGSWGGARVLDVYRQAQLPRFVQLRFYQHPREALEWVSVADARLLPRGAACGAIAYTLPTTKHRKEKVKFDEELARALQKMFLKRKADLVERQERKAASKKIKSKKM